MAIKKYNFTTGMDKTQRERTPRLLRLANLVCLALLVSSPAMGNNLRITNVSLEGRNQTAGTVVVEFDISWDNSWRTPVNHDAVWVLVKLRRSADVTEKWHHANLLTSGNDPVDTSRGTNPNIELYVPTDKKGAIIRFKSSQENPAFQGAAVSKNMRLTVDYYSILISHVEEFLVDVHGVEMVFIPSGPFMAGDGHNTDSFLALSSTTEHVWYISDDAELRTTAAGVCCKYYTQAFIQGLERDNEFSTGTTFTVPASFPLGYNAFYAMKYEITEGQYVDFLNTLTTQQVTNRNIVNSTKGTNATLARNTITGTTNTETIGTSRPDRAMGFLRYIDFAAYLDWAALRPMTELEYEKMSRGPGSVVRGGYAWGMNTYAADNVFSISPEDGTETFNDSKANITASAASNPLIHGDAIYGTCCNRGPVRAGIYAEESTSSRGQVGAGYYGNMELSGNVWEWAFSVGNSIAISTFTGEHGDGSITSNGFANFASAQWYSSPVVSANAIAGMRGGAYNTPTAHWQTSNRAQSNATFASTGSAWFGGRGVRSAETADESIVSEFSIEVPPAPPEE